MHQPGWERRPGQDTEVTATGTSGPLPTPRNGSFTFRNETTDTPTVPNYPTCPNPGWTATVTDVVFTGPATLTLSEDGIVSDTIVVPIT